MGLVMFGIYSIEHVSAYIFLRAHLPLLLSYYLQVVCFSTCQMFVLPWQPSEAFGSPGGKDAGPNSWGAQDDQFLCFDAVQSVGKPSQLSPNTGA